MSWNAWTTSLVLAFAAIGSLAPTVSGECRLVEVSSVSIDGLGEPLIVCYADSGDVYVSYHKSIGHFHISPSGELSKQSVLTIPELDGIQRLFIAPDQRHLVALVVHGTKNTRIAILRRSSTGELSLVDQTEWVGDKRHFRIRCPLDLAFTSNHNMVISDLMFLDYGNLQQGTVYRFHLSDEGKLSWKQTLFSKDDRLAGARQLEYSPKHQSVYVVAKDGIAVLDVKADDELEFSQLVEYPNAHKDRCHTLVLSADESKMYAMGGVHNAAEVLDEYRVEPQQLTHVRAHSIPAIVGDEFRGAYALERFDNLLFLRSFLSGHLVCLSLDDEPVKDQPKLIAETSLGTAEKYRGGMAIAAQKFLLVAFGHENRLVSFRIDR